MWASNMVLLNIGLTSLQHKSGRVVASPSVGSLGMKVREVIRTLEQEGWQQARQKGSHRQFQHPERPGVVTVAGAPADEVPKGTLASIWRQAHLRGQR